MEYRIIFELRNGWNYKLLFKEMEPLVNREYRVEQEEFNNQEYQEENADSNKLLIVYGVRGLGLGMLELWEFRLQLLEGTIGVVYMEVFSSTCLCYFSRCSFV